jgi:hypothetical protein
MNTQDLHNFLSIQIEENTQYVKMHIEYASGDKITSYLIGYIQALITVKNYIEAHQYEH